MLLARCVQPDRVLSVIPTERPLCWRGSVLVWYAHAGSSRASLASAPNPPLQPTASRTRSFAF
jgi:hypothetical protein